LKIYIITDMEGTAGILNFDDYCVPGNRYYERGVELATLEVNAAIEGALEAGATEILVADGHGYGGINPALLHPEARLLAGRPIDYPFGCNDSFDAAMIIGQHAKSNTDGGHLSHTGWFDQEDLTINGISLGEMGENFLFVAYFGVPTVMVSGDHAAMEEAKVLVPEIETAAVKEGWKRGPATGLTGDENRLFNGAAVHLHPTKARSLIKEKAQRGVKRCKEIQPFWIEPPYELVSTLRPAAKGQPNRIARVNSNDLLELLRLPREHSGYEPQITTDEPR